MSHCFEFHHYQNASEHFFEVPEVSRAPGTHTQWLSFRFRSEGMQRHSPASHFAIVLRAQLGRDESGRPCSIGGRGLAWGDTSAASPLPGNRFAAEPGFGGARGVLVESFWPGGNFLFHESRLLDEGLQDGLDYEVEVHVNDLRHVGYWISALGGARPDSALAASVQDRPEHPVPAGHSGIVIALGRGPGETGDWWARFSDIRFGWF